MKAITPRAITTVERSDNSLMSIIDRAMTGPEFDIVRITQLLELKERWDKAEAQKAYTRAMTAFKADPPQILKNKHVTAGQVHYDHATHDEVTGKIAEALAKHGLSHAWSMEQSDKGIAVTCTLTHVDGHSQSVKLAAGNDTSGAKNAIQAIASANTYLQRYTLLAITGLSTSDMPDDDGRGDVEHISLEQVNELEKLILEVGANRTAWLAYLKLDSLADMQAKNFEAAKKTLEAKRKKAATT
jgi:hypothetical protein